MMTISHIEVILRHRMFEASSFVFCCQEPEERLPTESIERRKRKLSVFLSDVREDDEEDDDLYTYIIDRENAQVGWRS